MFVEIIINKNKNDNLFNYCSKNLINQNNKKQLIKDINFKFKSIIKENKKIKQNLRKLNEEIDKIRVVISDKKLDNNSKENARKINDRYNTIESKIDKDMIGMNYPEIMFDDVKSKIINNKLISSLIEFLEQLEIKLIYLEKEINVTKLYSFYTSRTLYLNKKKNRL